jgi:hypothetical protein
VQIKALFVSLIQFKGQYFFLVVEWGLKWHRFTIQWVFFSFVRARTQVGVSDVPPVKSGRAMTLVSVRFTAALSRKLPVPSSQNGAAKRRFVVCLVQWANYDIVHSSQRNDVNNGSWHTSLVKWSRGALFRRIYVDVPKPLNGLFVCLFVCGLFSYTLGYIASSHLPDFDRVMYERSVLKDSWRPFFLHPCDAAFATSFKSNHAKCLKTARRIRYEHKYIPISIHLKLPILYGVQENQI